MDEAGALFMVSVFFGFLFFMSFLGADVNSSQPSASNPETVDACVNGSTVDCGFQTLNGLLGFFGTNVGVTGLQVVIIGPLLILLAWLFIKVLPTT